MSLQNPRGYPYENLANFLEYQSKFRISSVLEPKSVQVCCLENERRQISSGENRTLVNAKLPSAPPALRAGTSMLTESNPCSQGLKKAASPLSDIYTRNIS